MAYFKVTEHPKEDSMVREMQSKLNCIKTRYNCDWPYLQTDGKYGKQTALAVKGFQQYRNITPASGEMGDTTIRYINEAYGTVPKIAPASSDTFNNKPQKTSHHPLSDVFDVFVGVLGSMSDVIRGEMAYALQLGRCDGKAIANHFRNSMGQLDPKMKQLQNAFAKNKYAQQMLNQLENEASTLPRTPRNFSDTIQIKNNQREISRYQMSQRISANTTKLVSSQYINNLKKYDIVSKISNKLKAMGITGEIKLTNQKSIQFKAGGVFLIWSVKDLLWDLIQFNKWGDEDWKQDLLKDCYNFLDQLVIGLISWAIAEFVVMAVAAAVGATVSAGTLIVIIAVAAIIISLLISWLIAFFTKDFDENFSFSKYIWEGSVTQLLNTVYAIQ